MFRRGRERPDQSPHRLRPALTSVGPERVARSRPLSARRDSWPTNMTVVARIHRVAGGGATVFPPNALTDAKSVAVDSAGNVFVSDVDTTDVVIESFLPAEARERPRYATNGYRCRPADNRQSQMAEAESYDQGRVRGRGWGDGLRGHGRCSTWQWAPRWRPMAPIAYQVAVAATTSAWLRGRVRAT
jgi:hypothetical protein